MQRDYSLMLFALLLLTVAGSICAIAAEADTVPVVVRRVFDRMDQLPVSNKESQRELDNLRALYARRGFDLLWRRDGDASQQATALLEALRSAETYGLRSADYVDIALSAQFELATRLNSTPEQWARFDVALSAAAIKFVTHLHFGRVDPQACGFHLAEPRPNLDTAAILDQLAKTNRLDELLASLEPKFLHYHLLKQALARYRVLASKPNLTNLPNFSERSIKAGETYSGAPALRALLIALGDLSSSDTFATSDNQVLDPPLAAAIQRFQRRHGLDADGAIGKATFAALTTPLAQRVRQIEFGLERSRWLPAIETPPILVNIPQFRLFAFQSIDERSTTPLEMPVIVGQTYQNMRTPVFIDDMKYVVFRPYWDVPATIVKREMLPAIRANPGYLDKNNFEIVRGQSDDATPVEATTDNIAALASGRLRLRQRPGDNNSLGLVKFMFPNAHNIYLHSTPVRQLFEQSRRAFSHGCIRVSDPVGLAAHVLRDTPGEWTAEKIEAAMNGSQTLRVNLGKPIRVMILYSTAIATEAGEVLFFEDIYGHDRKVETLLDLQTKSASQP